MKQPDNLQAQPLSPQPVESFGRFVFSNPTNRRFVGIALIGMVVQFTLFKLAYPYGDFFPDSFSYIRAARDHVSINLWPIGYSKFLMIVHWFTHSDTVLVALQYALSMLSGLLFFMTVLYWFRPKRVLSIMVYVLLFFNPLLLYLNNYISADGLFLFLSFIWFTLLLWILFKPSPWMLVAHGLVLGIAFTVRYNAMYYPIVAFAVFAVSRYSLPLKLAGMALPAILIAAFVMFSRQAAYDISGIRQFSVFSGWQWANNALYMYPYVEVDSTTLPPGTEAFNREVYEYFNAPRNYLNPSRNVFIKNNMNNPIIGAHFIWFPASPLKTYYRKHIKDTTNETAVWSKVSPIYSAFGKHLIKEHPLSYARYFLLINTLNYFIPPMEMLRQYNLGNPKIAPEAQKWFGYETDMVDCVSFDMQQKLLFYLPGLFICTNMAFILAFVYFFQSKAYKGMRRSTLYGTLLAGLFFLGNMGFSILASPIVYRYQVFPLIIQIMFLGVICSHLWQVAQEATKQKVRSIIQTT